MTTAQAANLRSAQRIALNRAGLSVSVDETPSLSYEDRVKYLSELAAVILKYPDRFAPATVESAQFAAAKTYGPLEKYSLTDAFKDFTGEALNQAAAIGESLADVGAGVKNTLSLTKWLLPVAAVVVVVILLAAFARRSGVEIPRIGKKRKATA